MNFILCHRVCLLIDQRNYQCSEVCFNLFARCLELCLLFVEYRVVNNLVIILEDTWIRDLNNFYFSFIRLEGRSPRVDNSDILYILSSWPKEPDLWPHVLGSEGHNSKFFYRHVPSMHKTIEVVLHSTGCSHLSMSSCLVVDRLLLGLLLSRCKAPPMGTLICCARLAWVVRPNLPPWKIVGELDYYGSFVVTRV
jgi:hypothetical protein